MKVLILSGSYKPGPGQQTRSAAREIARFVSVGVREQGAETIEVDLRDAGLPFFDGRGADQLDVPGPRALRDAVDRASGVAITAPAYWRGVGGGLKNALDLLGGAAYDNPEVTPPFSGKPVGLVIVGAAAGDAAAARGQLVEILSAMGASVIEPVVTLDNPRQADDLEATVRGAVDLGYTLAIASTEAYGDPP